MRFEADELAGGLLKYDPLSLGISPGSCVVVDLTGFSDGPAAFAETAENWLNRLPCPSIALTAEPTWLKGFDLSVSSASEVNRLEAVTAANPVASTVLVQTLRLVEQLPVQSGLVVESLAFATLQRGEEFHRWLDALPSDAKTPASKVEAGPPVVTERRENTLEILLNRPGLRNEIDVEMRDALCEAFALAAMDDDIRHVDVRGLGDSFSIGGALSDFGRVGSGAAAHLIRSERLPARMLADHAHKYRFHLHGACVGAGVEIAAFGHHVTATPTAFLSLPEISMGLIPGAGGCVSVTKRIGRQRAAWMMMTGQRISARTALKWGLIDAMAG